jgi:hypothetical protein
MQMPFKTILLTSFLCVVTHGCFLYTQYQKKLFGQVIKITIKFPLGSGAVLEYLRLTSNVVKYGMISHLIFRNLDFYTIYYESIRSYIINCSFLGCEAGSSWIMKQFHVS